MKTLHRIAILVLLAASLALVGGCNFPRQASPQEVAQTAAAQTVSAQLTQISLASPTLPATNTPAPEAATATPTPPPPPTMPPATATTGCSDNLQFVADVTVPDNANYGAGAAFTKTWRLRNSGTCPWTTGYDVVFVSGNAMGGPASVPLAGPVPPGSTVDVSVNLTAPSTNGTHRGDYRMRNDKDVLFGLFFVQIVVGPTPTPTVSVYRTGSLTIDNTLMADLDAGTIIGDATADLWNEGVSPGVRQLTPRNGTRLLEMSGIPGYGDCSGASLGTAAVNFTDFGSGSWFCYKTSAGRFGRFEVEGLSAGSITIDFRTWN